MLSAPEDYGLTAAQTLNHRVEAAAPAGFDEFWQRFREQVASLPTRWHGTIDSTPSEVVIASLNSTRVIARVSIPSGMPRGVVIASHGYSEVPEKFEDEAEPWLEVGLATVRVRVRGYPPSTMDTPDLRGAWIMHGVESPDGWIVRGAAADLMQAARCARAHFGESVPVSMHGESLGGGLATLAAAQLTLMNAPPARLMLGLPTFGDWAWRASRYCNGAGGQVNVLIDALRGEDRERLMRGLLLYDAAYHARSILCPVLCKLAIADDTVPAPTAAAVFNGLGSEAKWRFLTRFGHFDGGIVDARRHALFERIHPPFAGAARPAAEVVAAIAHALEPREWPCWNAGAKRPEIL